MRVPKDAGPLDRPSGSRDEDRRQEQAGKPHGHVPKPKWDETAAPDDIWPVHAPDTD